MPTPILHVHFISCTLQLMWGVVECYPLSKPKREHESMDSEEYPDDEAVMSHVCTISNSLT